MDKITTENTPNHIHRLYQFVSAIANNHNKIVNHLRNIHQNVTDLSNNVKEIRRTINQNPQGTAPNEPTPYVQTKSPSRSPRSPKSPLNLSPNSMPNLPSPKL